MSTSATERDLAAGCRLSRAGATFLALTAALMFTTSCASRVWFTERLRDSLAARPDQEKGADRPPALNGPEKLQYYVSERIVLRRDITNRREGVSQGRLLVRRGRLIERIVIRSGTPGVAVEHGDGWVAVSFSKGTSLVFALDEDAQRTTPYLPRAIPNDTYLLKTTGSAPELQVEFDGHLWRPTSTSSKARLMVSRREHGKNRYRRRVLRGMKLAQR